MVFYQQNYPKSFQKTQIIWNIKKDLIIINEKKSFSEIVNSMDEAQLRIARLIADYSLREKNYENKHERISQFKQIKSKVAKLIPGGRFIEEEEQLKQEIYDKEKRQTEIREIIEKERKELREKLQKTEVPKPIEPIKPIEAKIEEPKKEDKTKITITEPTTPKYACPICKDNVDYKTGAGLASHTNHKHPNLNGGTK